MKVSEYLAYYLQQKLNVEWFDKPVDDVIQQGIEAFMSAENRKILVLDARGNEIINPSLAFSLTRDRQRMLLKKGEL